MTSAISVSGLNKTYKSGFKALTDINLDISKGEIFALLGPNGGWQGPRSSPSFVEL